MTARPAPSIAIAAADPSGSERMIFQNSETVEPAFDETLKFERPDWSLFRTVEGLQQRAGVQKRLLRCLVVKELVDNGLDNGGDVKIETLPDNGYAIVDDGPGIDPELRGQTERVHLAVRGSPIVELTNQTTVLHGPRGPVWAPKRADDSIPPPRLAGRRHDREVLVE
jgi:hypothetical protein